MISYLDMLSYTEFSQNTTPSDISISIKIILDGFDPDSEFTPITMDFILSKNYISGEYKKNKCSINDCNKIARRNYMCKKHNLEFNYSEKCSFKRCKNMKEMSGTGKKNTHCYRHKINKNKSYKSSS
jgi:hypothetical protein